MPFPNPPIWGPIGGPQPEEKREIPDSYKPMAFRDNFERDAIRQLNNWTSKIDGKVNVCQLSIPGTHDSHATYANTKLPRDGPAEWGAKLDPGQVRAFATTQYLEIYQQLRAGVRYLDLRVGGDLNMRHGIVPLHMHLKDTLRYIQQYLTDPDHPNETVIISVMRDQGPDGSIHSFVKQKWDEYQWYSGVNWPLLEEVRGKAILFRRFDTDGSSEYGINGKAFYDDKDRLGGGKAGQWSQQDVQKDNERMYPDDKWNHVWPHLDTALRNTDSNVMFFTGLPNSKPPLDWKEGLMNSLAAGAMQTPEHFASLLNPRLLRELAKARMDVNEPQKQRLGIIVLDFIKPEHCVKIIAKNFPQEIQQDAKSWNGGQRVHQRDFGNGVHIEFQSSDGHLVAYGASGPLWAVPVLADKPEAVKMHWSGNELGIFQYNKGVEKKYFAAAPAWGGARLRWIAGPPYMMIDTEQGDGRILYCSIPGDWLANTRYGEENYHP